MAPAPCASITGSAHFVVRNALVRLNSSWAAQSSSLSSTGAAGHRAAHFIDEHVQTAPMLADRGDYPLDLAAVGHVGGLDGAGAALALDDLPRRLCGGRVTVECDDARTFAGEERSGGAAVGPSRGRPSLRP